MRQRSTKIAKELVKAVVLAALLTHSVVALSQTQQATPPKNEQPEDKLATPLMRAAYSGRVDEVRELLKKGVDVNESEPIGFTALMVAVGFGHIEVVDILLKAGADPNAAGGVAHVGFWSVMIMAMKPSSKRLELIDMLIAAGGKLNPPRNYPLSPLMTAVQNKDIELMNALLARGADVDWANSIGSTALEDAVTAQEPSAEVVAFLLKAGADPNKPRLSVGNFCVSLLQSIEDGLKMSNNKTDREIRDLIIRAGAKRYKRNSRGSPCYE